jgi:hypothetical protein
MNELQRQQYLSALGVDSYTPRIHLPYAPVSVACELPVDAYQQSEPVLNDSLPISVTPSSNAHPKTLVKHELGASPVNHLIGDILDNKRISKPVVAATSAADILAGLETRIVTIDPFSLSIWRPVDGLLVIDSRNSKLALPTEMLLKNILRTLYPDQPAQMQEEILRWPMIENSFAKRTQAEARSELQTWLAVQCEIRPVRYIWLLGKNAAEYLLRESETFADVIFNTRALVETRVADMQVAGLLLPSLNEILQSPHHKPALFAALRRYHVLS